jgi:hypothetical protein
VIRTPIGEAVPRIVAELLASVPPQEAAG